MIDDVEFSTSNSEKLAALTKSRGYLKANLTRFRNYSQSLDINSNKTQAKHRLKKFETILDEFTVIQNQIEDIDQSEKQLKERDSFENQFFDLCAVVDDFITKSLDFVSAVGSSQSNNLQTNQVKLPEISIPEFNGDYTKWTSFYQTFDSLIHKNQTLSNAQRFHYLKASVKGEASMLIQSLEITDDNYLIALQALQDRYNNKRLIVKMHVNKLCNLPIASKNSANSLRQLINTVSVNLEAIKTFGQKINDWDLLLIELITSKLDYSTIREWETVKLSGELPTYKELHNFLTSKCKMLEALQHFNGNPNQNSSNVNQHNKQFKQRQTNHVVVNNPHCKFCQQSHYIQNCENLLKLSSEAKFKEIKTLKLCINCFREGHSADQCRSKYKCRFCKKKHNSMLHTNFSTDAPASGTSSSATNETVEAQDSNSPLPSSINHVNRVNSISQVLLSTAIVQVRNARGDFINLRCLLDQGSQSNLITEDACIKLQLKPKKTNIPISGINKSVSIINKSVNVHMKSLYNAFTASFSCLVLQEITDNLPLITFNKSNINIPKELKLADINFNINSKIDLLIGAEVFWQLLCVGQINNGVNQPVLQKTQLGWIVSGKVEGPKVEKTYNNCNISVCKLDSQLKKFWEINEFENNYSSAHKIESECERSFADTHTRESTGRYVVKLPFKQNPSTLGESKNRALSRLFSLEKKFTINPELKESYVKFMTEYQNLNHMQLVQSDNWDTDPSRTFYLPHHAVFKESSSSTKVRVVFDGSAKSSSGVSINDNLLVGPTIQQDLFSILIRFRTHKYAITADITKMYRQILIAEEDRDYQRILWRKDQNDPVQTFRLNTVTYGTSCAPFLAIRSLFQLAFDEKSDFPLVYKIILRDFYVDDVLTGSNDLEVAKIIKEQLISLLKRGGFELSKWLSNNSYLRGIDNDINQSSLVNLDKQENTKVLGLSWDYNSDILVYKYTETPYTAKITKRLILSTIAKLFDPLGLVGPILVSAKILMQKLWSLKVEWDESVPLNIHTDFLEFIKQLPLLNNLKIDRQIIGNYSATPYEIHGFCDASQSAYGACIYLRVFKHNDEYESNLICAKSRIAPLKTISIPKLELCGALLLASLIRKVLDSLNLNISKTYLWTDSTIVLAWLNSESSRWKTFVANRVSKIQSLTDISNWNHIKTESNPADVISRGTTPCTLLNSDLWWHGPTFLKRSFSLPNEISIPSYDEVIPEGKKIVTLITRTVLPAFFYKFSKFVKLQRVFAYCLRFVHNCKNKSNKRTNILTNIELQCALNKIILLVQNHEFEDDIKTLQNKGHVERSSKLLSLSPFLDSAGFLRVGGRLKNSVLPYNTKHPILLPAKHFITKLIIKQEHERLLHAGQQTTLSSIRQTYWPLNAKCTVRHVIHNCVKCFKANPKGVTQPMGNLPSCRLDKVRPFLSCGVDFAGPITLIRSRNRNQSTIKSYIVVFVCLATKALHLDLASNLTSECFINCLRRLIARRGNIANLYCDNATNFIGAKRQLNDDYNDIKKCVNDKEVLNEIAKLNISWHHIPPRGPHHGGIWEQGVKAVKTHLRRVIGDVHLNHEEMYTLLTRIEAVLNSRPLCPLSPDPNDLQVLTPAHFLIGEPLTAPVEVNLTDIKINRLTRWQRIEQLRQHFWKRWSREYLTQHQQRQKWLSSKPFEFKIGMLAIIRDDNQPPLKWPLGRIIQLHPGNDGITRVVSLKTINGTVKRPIVKICVLPNSLESDSD